MSEYTDSLREENDPPFKTYILDQLSHAEGKEDRVVEIVENAYWQGRKDAFRLILAYYLSQPR